MITYHNSLLEYTGGESFFDEIFGGLEEGKCGCDLSDDDTDSVDNMLSDTDSSNRDMFGGADSDSADDDVYADSEFIIRDGGSGDGDSADDTDSIVGDSEFIERVGGEENELEQHIESIFGGDNESPFIETAPIEAVDEEEKLRPSIIISEEEAGDDTLADISPYIDYSSADISSADTATDGGDTVQDIVGGMLNLF